MDPIEFQELLSANPNKFCEVFLKNGKVYDGINVGIVHDGYGQLILKLENKGGNHTVAHAEVENIYFMD